jgi:RNA methyltransferase, TrmH family
MDSVVHDRLRAVTSRQNAIVKQLRRSFSQGEIVDGCCAIEGLRMIEEAIRSGLKIRAIFFSKSGEIKAERLLNQVGRHAETLLLPDDVFKSAVETEHPQGVAALVKAPAFSSDALFARPDPLIVVAAGIQDPGNLGAIIRSAEAFGAAVVLTEKTVALWNAKVVRSSAGSVFRVLTVQMTAANVFELCAQHNIQIAAAVARNGTRIQDFDFTNATAVFVGNEGAGLPHDLLQKSGSRICIPQSEPLESLNAGIAASIILYEATRQRAGQEPAGMS